MSGSLMPSASVSVSASTSALAQSIAPAATNANTRVLPWRDTNHSPLTGTELKTLVVEAALKEEHDNDDDDDEDRYLDVPGIAWMEHLNLIVGTCSADAKVAESFYIDTMGLTPDKSKSFHVNLGRQQFHLATPKRDDEIPHRIHGSIGLVVPDLDALWERLVAARTRTRDNNDSDNDNDRGLLEGTLFDFYKEEERGAETETTTAIVHVRCPWGNVFRCYSASDRGNCNYEGSSSSSSSATTPIQESPQKMTNLHAPRIGVHGSDKMGVLSVGAPGIRFVEFVLPKGVKAKDVCEFYKDTIKCSATIGNTKTSSGSDLDCCLVSVGPGIHLVYAESPDSIDTTMEDEAELFHRMKGVHVCIYAHDFYRLYHRLEDRSLVWTNPRFTRLDRCDTWEDAKRSRTLRFRHLVDSQNKVLMELEHETRPLRHGQFMKVPYYVPR